VDDELMTVAPQTIDNNLSQWGGGGYSIKSLMEVDGGDEMMEEGEEEHEEKAQHPSMNVCGETPAMDPNHPQPSTGKMMEEGRRRGHNTHQRTSVENRLQRILIISDLPPVQCKSIMNTTNNRRPFDTL